MILFKIAFRNLREHSIKTLIIGTLVALGVALLIIGNSVMSTITQGMKASYSENFTGDLIVRNVSEESVNFVAGFGGNTPTLSRYAAISDALKQHDVVTVTTPLLTGAATVNSPEEALGFAVLWGIEPTSYLEMFPESFTLTDGHFLEDDQEGVVLSQNVIDDIERNTGKQIAPGDSVLLSSINSTSGNKIREVTVRGIGYFENGVGLLDNISLVDISTLRALLGLTAVKMAADESASTAVDESAMFGDALFSEDVITETVESAPLDFENILGDTSVRDRYMVLDNDAWHFILIRLVPGASEREASSLLHHLQQDKALGDDFLVENWRWGAGFPAELAFGVRNIVNIIIIAIAIVAFIIIMNTLVISITERITEIGTIRAIGGQRTFVRAMITLEVLMITVVFGLVGIVVGVGVIAALAQIGFQPSNLFFNILLGGNTLRPVLAIGSLGSSLISVVVIGVLASLYPVAVALGVTPVQAMQRN